MKYHYSVSFAAMLLIYIYIYLYIYIYIFIARQEWLELIVSRAFCGSQALASSVLCVHAATAVPCAMCTP